MASRVDTLDFLIPAGTAIATPVSASLYSTRAALSTLDIKVPPGPSGLVGFSFWHSSDQIIPKTAGRWVITDDETIRWDLDGYSDQPGWVIKGYNTDVYDHTIYVTMLLDEWQPPARANSTPEERIPE